MREMIVAEQPQQPLKLLNPASANLTAVVEEDALVMLKQPPDHQRRRIGPHLMFSPPCVAFASPTRPDDAAYSGNCT